MSRRQFLSPKSQAGQAIVLIAFMIIVLFGAVGLAVDGGIAYYYNAGAERAAAAAALSGVIFMPKQFLSTDSIPAAAGNDATDRAIAAAKRNGFANGVNNVTVSVQRYTDPISGVIQNESLQVTVSRQVPTFFMQLFGFSSISVSRTAVAQYLKPLKLGEPCLFPPAGPGDCHTGSTVSQLGNGGYYFLRTEGWDTDRGQGDAYTPNVNKAGCASCPSTDVHSISGSQATDVADPSLPNTGGYNYILTVPAGFTAQLQMYNATFAPDGNAGGKNFCENFLTGQPGHACSSGGNYYMHEDDTAPYGTTPLYSAMRYTIFSAPSVFIRSSDTIMSQMTVMPVDASNWQSNAAGGTDTGGNAPYYIDPNTNKKITQTFGTAVTCAPLANGCPTVMSAYHAWMNVGGYVPSTSCSPTVVCPAGYEAESAIIKYAAGRGPIGALPEGTYRLRIDTLNADGTISSGSGNTQAHKGMAVRVMDGANPAATCGNAASPCSLSALDDLSFFTPISTPAGGTFRIPVFSVPAIYAGLTIGIDVFDPGDINANGGSAYLGFVDPTTCNVFKEPAGGLTASVYDLQNQRSNLGTGLQTTVGSYANPNPVEQLVNNSGVQPYNGHWLHFDIPIPSTYAPNPAGTACDPTGQGYWNLQYRTTANVSAVDTLTITLNLRGNPAHILKS
jgi:Putative Tad-like Flp pilus-assembly